VNKYIGIDVAKEDLSVYDGIKEYRFRNTKDCTDLKEYLSEAFASLNEPVLIFEATGPYSLYLREFCARHQIRASIINPIKSSSFTKALGNRSKTDTIDAKMLYEFHKVIQPQHIMVPRIDEDAEQLSLYLASYELMIKTRTAISNHLHALAHTPQVPSLLMNMLIKELKTVQEAEKELLRQMEAYIDKNQELKVDYQNLLTIKGIGRVSAVSLLALFKTYQNTSRNEITALAGLDPTRIESGTSVKGRSKISKGGNSTVRKILYFPTLNCIQHNKQIRTFYERLVDNHKPKKLAVIAAMRKLLLVSHAVYTSRVPYREAA
jgi:transposase